jgi:hypothetical protein
MSIIRKQYEVLRFAGMEVCVIAGGREARFGWSVGALNFHILVDPKLAGRSGA